MSDELPKELLDWYLKGGHTPEELILYDRLQDGICMGQHQFDLPGHLHRMSTAYESVLSNYTCCCAECEEEIDEYWEDRWQEYWAGQF